MVEEEGWIVRKIQVLLQDGDRLVLKDLDNDEQYIDRLIELIDKKK